jgi:hypothetical protein
MIRNFASQIAGRELGVSWVDRFCKRYSEDLISTWAGSIDRNRCRADSSLKYKLYFDLLSQKLSQYSIELRHTYNIDEKGFLLGVVTKSKRVFSKSVYERGKLRLYIQDGNREWITLVACICADGSHLEPALIYQSDSGSLQDTWLQALDPENQQVQFSSSESGWTNNKIGLAWLK